ncbi:MAG: hypothetical protein ABSH14_18035 [Verrucomicrobiia bacterium]|jgi:hypothetical protein
MKQLKVALAVVLGLGVVWGMNATAKENKSDKDETKVGDTAFIAYEGSQSWPTGTGSQVNKDYSIPIYIGLPDKSYKVLGRVYDKRTSGLGVVDHAFDEGLGKESHRMRNCANQAKQHGADAIVVTDDEKAIKVFNLSKKDVRESAPLFDHEHSIVLAIKF